MAYRNPISGGNNRGGMWASSFSPGKSRGLSSSLGQSRGQSKSNFMRPGALPGYNPTPGNQRPTGPGYRGDDGIWYGSTPTSPGEIEPGQGTGLPDYRPGVETNPSTPGGGLPGTGFQPPGVPLPGMHGGPRPNTGNQPPSGPLPGMNSPLPTGTPGQQMPNPPWNPTASMPSFPTGPGSPTNPGGMPGTPPGGPMGQPGFQWPTPGQNWPGGPNNRWPTFDQGLGGDPTFVDGGSDLGTPGNDAVDTTFYNPMSNHYGVPGYQVPGMSAGFGNGMSGGYGFGGGLAGSMGSSNSWADPSRLRQGVNPGNPMTGGGFQAPGGGGGQPQGNPPRPGEPGGPGGPPDPHSGLTYEQMNDPRNDQTTPYRPPPGRGWGWG